jgi:signal transduction histidine kinase
MNIKKYFHKRKKSFSIAEKIKIPFYCIEIFISLLLIGLFTQYQYSNPLKKIENQLINKSKIVQKQLETLVFQYDELIDNYMVSIIDNHQKEISQAQEELIRKSIKAYKIPAKLTKKEESIYKTLLNSSAQEPCQIFVDQKERNKANLNIFLLKRKSKKRKILEMLFKYNINLQLITKLQKTDPIEVAYILLQDQNKFSNAQFIASSKLIRNNFLLQEKILKITNYAPKATIYQKLIVKNEEYYLFFKQQELQKNIYSVIVMPAISYQKELFIKSAVFAAFLATISILLAIFFSLIIDRILEPVYQFVTIIKNIYPEKFKQELKIGPGNETKILAKVFHSLQQELKLNSQDLFIKNHYLSTIISMLPQGMLITDQNNKVLLINKQAENALHIKSSDIYKKNIFHYLKHREFLNIFKTLFKESTPKTFSEITNRKIENKYYSFITRKININNNQFHNIIVIEDITHHHKLEQIRKRFVNTISHELRTPLTSIIGFLELALDKPAKAFDDQQLQYLHIALKEAAKLKTTTDEIQEIANMELEKSKIHREKIKLQKLYSKLAPHLPNLFQKKDIEIQFHKPTLNCEINIDIGKIQRIINGLLLFMFSKNKEKGSFDINLSYLNTKLTVNIKNTKSRITKKEIENINLILDSQKDVEKLTSLMANIEYKDFIIALKFINLLEGTMKTIQSAKEELNIIFEIPNLNADI